MLLCELEQEAADAGPVVDVDLSGVMRKELAVDLSFCSRERETEQGRLLEGSLERDLKSLSARCRR